MTDRALHLAERIDRASDAQTALRVLDEAINATTAIYQTAFEEVAAKEPWETHKISILAVSLQAVKLVTAHLRAAASDADAARADLNYLRQIQRLTPERRKALGMQLLGD